MKQLKIQRLENAEEATSDSFISFNFLLVKGKLTDPKTQRLLMVLAFFLLGKISPENIPFWKTLIELFNGIR